MQRFSETDINTLTEELWLSMLNMPTSLIDPRAADQAPGRTISGIVNIGGEWSGAIVLHLPYELAERVAATMFSLGDMAPTLADLQDSVGELVNMTGGGIKALIPGLCYLSLPTVVEGTDFSVRFPGMELTERVAFQHESWPFVISIVTAATAAAPTAH